MIYFNANNKLHLHNSIYILYQLTFLHNNFDICSSFWNHYLKFPIYFVGISCNIRFYYSSYSISEPFFVPFFSFINATPKSFSFHQSFVTFHPSNLLETFLFESFNKISVSHRTRNATKSNRFSTVDHPTRRGRTIIITNREGSEKSQKKKKKKERIVFDSSSFQ